MKFHLTLYSAEEVGFYKPQPQAYQANIEDMGIATKDAFFMAGSSGDVAVGKTELVYRKTVRNLI